MRPGSGIARLLALLLLLQWASAMEPHARALVALANAVPVELCGAHGARTVLLGEDGQPADRAAAPDCCAGCLVPVAGPPPQSLAPPRPVFHALAPAVPARPGLPPLPPRAPPQLPRAPPVA